MRKSKEKAVKRGILRYLFGLKSAVNRCFYRYGAVFGLCMMFDG